MKKRNQFFKRICSILCALVVFVSLFGVDDSFSASISSENEILNLESSDFVDEYDFQFYCDYSGNTFYISYLGHEYLIRFDSSSSYYVSGDGYCPGVGGHATYIRNSNGLWSRRSNGPYGGCLETYIENLVRTHNPEFSLPTRWYYSDLPSDMVIYTTTDFGYKYSNMSSFSNLLGFTGWSPNYNDILYGKYNPLFGYLQNVSRKSTYIRDELYNYDDDSLTYHWYHDLTSTGGVDLSSGDYKIRHYISNAKVKGYDKADIVEMSEKYLMNEYDASKGYFSYLQNDYLEKLEALGYEEIGFIDKYLKGYFTLQHHYFQIVNTSTNEVGGYLHFYPKDASGENFGVEMVYEGLDLNDEIDPDAPNGFIDTDVGSGTTVEDALENADAPKLDDLGGIDPLIENLEGYASQITNVTNGIGALLGSLPPWFVGLLGLSFGLFFVLVAVKVLRG